MQPAISYVYFLFTTFPVSGRGCRRLRG